MISLKCPKCSDDIELEDSLAGKETQVICQKCGHQLTLSISGIIEPPSSLERILTGVFIGLPTGVIGIGSIAAAIDMFSSKSYWGLLPLAFGLVLVFISRQILAGRNKDYTNEQKKRMNNVDTSALWHHKF